MSAGIPGSEALIVDGAAVGDVGGVLVGGVLAGRPAGAEVVDGELAASGVEVSGVEHPTTVSNATAQTAMGAMGW